MQWVCNVHESFNKRLVEIEKSHCPSYFHDIHGRGPFVNSGNFDGVHACHPLFKDYPQVIHRWHMEKAFFGFEEEVMLLSDLENIPDCGDVVLHVGACCNTNIVHVYTDRGSSYFMLKDDFLIDVVHHGLKGGWQVCKAEVHHGWFE